MRGEARGEAKDDGGEELQDVARLVDARQRDGVAAGVLEGQQAVGVGFGATRGRTIHPIQGVHALLAAIHPPGELVDQGRGKGVDQRRQSARGLDVIAVLELPPGAAGGADGAGVAIHGLVVVQQARIEDRL